jgi:membrane protein YqaA with SNARE-associated domain
MTDVASLTPADSATPGQPAHTPKAKGPLGAVYNWMMRLAAGNKAEPALYTISFAESSFFPIPPDVMLAPMCFARPERWVRYALGCTIASVFGAILGYAIGFYLFEAVGTHILSFFGYGDKQAELQAAYASAGVWIILLKGVTPIPFKLVTIVSGAMHFDPLIFIASCLVTRAARFFLVGWLFQKFGPTLAPVIEKRIGLFSLAFVVILIGGFAAATLIH